MNCAKCGMRVPEQGVDTYCASCRRWLGGPISAADTTTTAQSLVEMLANRIPAGSTVKLSTTLRVHIVDAENGKQQVSVTTMIDNCTADDLAAELTRSGFNIKLCT